MILLYAILILLALGLLVALVEEMDVGSEGMSTAYL